MGTGTREIAISQLREIPFCTRLLAVISRGSGLVGVRELAHGCPILSFAHPRLCFPAPKAKMKHREAMKLNNDRGGISACKVAKVYKTH